MNDASVGISQSLYKICVCVNVSRACKGIVTRWMLRNGCYINALKFKTLSNQQQYKIARCLRSKRLVLFLRASLSVLKLLWTPHKGNNSVISRSSACFLMDFSIVLYWMCYAIYCACSESFLLETVRLDFCIIKIILNAFIKVDIYSKLIVVFLHFCGLYHCYVEVS